MKHNRLQLLLDLKALGATMRNIAAIQNPDAEMSRKIFAIRNNILRRYNSHDVKGCMFKIYMLLADKQNV